MLKHKLLGLLPESVKLNAAKYVRNHVRPRLRKWQVRDVPFEKLMLGDEASIEANRFAHMSGELGRPSISMTKSPHVKLLKKFDDLGEVVFEPENFQSTAYYSNAVKVLDLVGNYFDCTSNAEIVEQAKRFIKMYQTFDESAENQHGKPDLAHTPRGWPIVVRRIADSDGAVQIVDGHHRAAIMYCKGNSTCPVYALRTPPRHTPMQKLVLDGVWTEGEKVLYQPIQTADFGQVWKRPRKCVDRLQMMEHWLAKNGIQSDGSRYIDLGSNYGWFVSQMASAGFDAHGAERDVFGINTGAIAYDLDPARIHKLELTRFLKSCEEKYDVVSCFSVLHHFALGKSRTTAEELISLISSVTGKVLFFDTGQAHENWFKHSLADWTDEYIPNWIVENSSFTKVEMIGRDEDRVTPYEDNYGRALFACTFT
jgi:hypothetical protein